MNIMRKCAASALAAILMLGMIPLRVFGASAAEPEIHVTVTQVTATVIAETTVYAGEIFVDGESAVRYLYSDDVTASSTVLAAVRDALAASEHAAFAELITEDLVKDGAGIAVLGESGLTEQDGDDLKDAAMAAAKLCPEYAASGASSVDLYGTDAGFTAQCDTCFDPGDEIPVSIVDGDDAPYAIRGALGVRASSNVDTVTYTVIDGKLQKLIERYMKYDCESVTVIYTSVSLESPHAHVLEKVERAEPTKDADGWTEHWRCAECGALFADEDGKTEVTADEIALKYTEPEFAVGDLNRDGKVNARDVYLIMKSIVAGTAGEDPAFDINGDGKVNSRDVVALMKSLVNK